MMGWLAVCMPLTYATLKVHAMLRHELFGPVLGTHARDEWIRTVYPL
jgi:hypothetical protein